MAEASEQCQHNLMTLSMVKQFNLDGKYWDVQLRVDNKVFKCQRSVLAANSEYFDTMFSSNFEESNTSKDQPIPLNEFDAAAFEELLNFMYTGDICVKDSNILPFLFMNDFLRLRTGLVKKWCLEYVKSCSKDNKLISNVLDLLRFAHLNGEKVFVDILNAHICSHLLHYSKHGQLMEMSFEILNALLEFCKEYVLRLRGSADVLLKIVHNWINHNRQRRSRFRSNLMENVDFAMVSSNFSRSLINRLERTVDEVVNLSKDIESLTESKILAIGIDTNLTDGDAQFDAIISFTFTNVSKMQIDTSLMSSSWIISNLSWKIGIEREDDELGMYLYCDGTPMSSEWNCYASATFTIVSHKEERDDFVKEMSLILFTSNNKSCVYGPPTFMKWNDLTDKENGYITDDDSITMNVSVHADVPFLEMMYVG